MSHPRAGHPTLPHVATLVALVLALAVAGCPRAGEDSRPDGANDVVYRNGIVVTMDDAKPRAQAVLVRGERIAAVGSNDEVVRLAGPGARVVDLAGRTVVPGFIDAHSHRLGDFANVGYHSAAEVVPDTLAQGWTGLHELFVNQERLDNLQALDRAGALRLRVDAYLPVNSPEVTSYGDWYAAYRPGQMMTPRVRIAGLKFFVDFDSGREIRWTQADLSAAIGAAHRQGWQVAAKSIGSATLDMILNAIDAAQQGRSDPRWRHRIEHILSVTPGQADRMRKLGVIAIFQTNMPGQTVGDPDIAALIKREPPGAFTPWRTLESKGVLMAGGTGWPSYYAAEPTGPPFASPMRLLYQAVTRTGNHASPPEPWMLAEAITVEQALRAYTMGAAYASFADAERGSIKVGKLADLVVLSANPLDVPTQQILTIQVLSTVIGGRVEFCASSATALCPSGQPSATSTPSTSAGNSVTVASGATLRLAVLAPFSGQRSPLGAAIRGGVDLAVADAGAVAGFGVSVLTVDDACDRARGAAAAAEVVAANPVAVIGPACSAPAHTALPVLEQAGLPAVSGSATAVDLPGLAPTVFARSLLDDDQLTASGKTAADVNALPAVTALLARYASRFGSAPPAEYRPYVAYAYDATMILLKAAGRASQPSGGALLVDRTALARAVRATVNHPGVTGSISIDARGNRVA